jgi:CheY-like chemotaxis protein
MNASTQATQEQPEKLRVLVVDDDPVWVDGLQAQSAKLQKSRLQIEASHSFKDGLDYLENNREVDVVVVDYLLDKSHVGWDFINKARGLGMLVPYVIVSNQSTEVVSDRAEFGDLMQSSPSDFIQKIEIDSFKNFQDRIFASYRKFRDNVVATMASYFTDQRNTLQSMWVLMCEIQLLHRTLCSYSAKVNDPSFVSVSSVISSNIDNLQSYLRYAMDLIPNHSELVHDQALFNNSEIANSRSRLKVADYIPYSKHRRATLAWISRCEAGLTELKGDPEAYKNVISGLIKREDKSAQSFAEIVALHLANQLAQHGQVDGGVDLLYYLSQHFAHRRQNARVAGTDILTAAFLLQHGRPKDAAAYVSAAGKLASRLNDDRLTGALQQLTSLENEAS